MAPYDVNLSWKNPKVTDTQISVKTLKTKNQFYWRTEDMC